MAQLNNAAYSINMDKVRHQYNADVDAANAYDQKVGITPQNKRSYFDDLSGDMQTVVTSTSYNMGVNYKTKGPNHKRIWDNLVNNNSAGAAAALRSWADDEPTPGLQIRRRSEAKLLDGNSN